MDPIKFYRVYFSCRCNDWEMTTCKWLPPDNMSGIEPHEILFQWWGCPDCLCDSFEASVWDVTEVDPDAEIEGNLRTILKQNLFRCLEFD